jgi:proline iminopeptidase
MIMKYIAFTLLIITTSISLFSQRDPNIYSKFKSEFVKIDGYNINIEVLGEGEPIFFFAGGPGNSHDYMQGNFGHYYKTHKVVFIDMLGRGKSDDAKDKSEYSIENDVYITEEIRKHLKLGKIAVMGHSYGTMVAQGYATTYPENTSKLIIIAGFHSGEMWQNNCDNYNHMARTTFPEKWKIVDSLRALGYVSSDQVFNDHYGSFPTRYIYYHNTKTKSTGPKEKYRSWNNDVYYGMLGEDGDFFVGGSIMRADYRRQLKDLNFPILIMAGRYDGVSTPLYNIQYKQFAPQAQFVMFEDSGHNPYLEEPAKFYKILNKFLGVK